MKTLFIFLVGAALGFWIGKNRSLKSPLPLADSGLPLRKGGEEKEQRKEKIMEMFEGQTEIKNDDVQKGLNVSDASATNYLSELEKEGKIEQMGEKGRFVSYRKKS